MIRDQEHAHGLAIVPSIAGSDKKVTEVIIDVEMLAAKLAD